MKKLILLAALLLGTSTFTLASEVDSSDSRVMRTMDGISGNLTAFAGSTRGAALDYFKSKTKRDASVRVKLYALDYLKESVIYFDATTSIRSHRIVRNIALTSQNKDVALKAIDTLEPALAFRWSGSIQERLSALNCLLDITKSESFKANRAVQDHAAQVLTPYMDSNYDSIRGKVLNFLENY